MLLSQFDQFRHEPPRAEDLRVLFMGGFWMGANDLVKMYLRSLQDFGAEVCAYSTDSHRDALDCGGRSYDYGYMGPVYLRYERVRGLIEDFNPHLIVCCAGGLSFRDEDAARLRERYCLIGVALSDPDVFPRNTAVIAKNFDRFFTNDRNALPLYRSIGCEAIWLPFACYPPYHRRLPPDSRFSCDVLFVGQARPERVDLVRRIQSNFDTALFGTGWDELGVPNRGRLSAEDVIAAINSAKVCLDFARNLAGDYMVKYRVFEFAGCGAVACTERFDDLAAHFAYDREILGYDNEDELLNQIRTCLTRPEYRTWIGENAYTRSRAEHTFQHRWEMLIAEAWSATGSAPIR